MEEVERDLEVIFDVIPTSEDLPSKLSAEKLYALCYHVVMHINCITCALPTFTLNFTYKAKQQKIYALLMLYIRIHAYIRNAH